MNRSIGGSRRPFLRGWLLAAGALGGGMVLAAAAGQVFVTVPTLDVRDGRGAAAKVVATVKKGDVLEVAQDGKWLKVRVNGQEGYVFSGSVSREKVAKASPTSNPLFPGDAAAGELASAEAAKGLDELTLGYASTKSLDRKPLDLMLQMREELVDYDDWEAFNKEGKLGEFKPR